MCKRSIADSAAKSCDCSNPDYSWAVAGLDDEIDSLYDGEPTLGRMLEATVGWYNFDEIKSQICSLTNDILPVFEMQDICVCSSQISNLATCPRRPLSSKQPTRHSCAWRSGSSARQTARQTKSKVPFSRTGPTSLASSCFILRCN